MLFYYSLFVWLIFSSITKNRLFKVITIIIFIIFVGLRFEVGGDWGNYLIMYKVLSGNSLKVYLAATDPGYGFLNYLAYNLNYNMWFVNTICATFLFISLDYFCKNTKNYWVSFLVTFPYIILSVSMGYTRQSVAIGFAMVAIVHLLKGNKYNFLIWIFFALLFHKSAILLLIFTPYAFNIKLTGFKNVLYFLSFIIVLFLVMGKLSSQDNLYFSEEVNSAGALARMIIHAPALVFYIMYRNKLKKIYKDKLPVLDAFLALIIIFFLVSFVYSTFADRFNLYFYMFDMIVLSSLTIFFDRSNYYIYLALLIIFQLILMFVWLNYSPWAQCCWIPYQNYLWIN